MKEETTRVESLTGLGIYAKVSTMEKAKLFKNGQSQAVRLPKALRFSGTEVYANRLGSIVTLVPVEDPWRSLRDGIGMFSDDFLVERSQPPVQSRRGL